MAYSFLSRFRIKEGAEDRFIAAARKMEPEERQPPSIPPSPTSM